jgi:tRNA(Phe) wybutosine-synthesizing methylase Tyw3
VAQVTPSPAGNILNVGAPQLTAADLGATPAIEGGFRQSEISSRESQFLIESPTIRNEG